MFGFSLALIHRRFRSLPRAFFSLNTVEKSSTSCRNIANLLDLCLSSALRSEWHIGVRFWLNRLSFRVVEAPTPTFFVVYSTVEREILIVLVVLKCSLCWDYLIRHGEPCHLPQGEGKVGAFPIRHHWNYLLILIKTNLIQRARRSLCLAFPWRGRCHR